MPVGLTSVAITGEMVEQLNKEQALAINTPAVRHGSIALPAATRSRAVNTHTHSTELLV